jgi:hypothetical protein
MLPSIQAVPAGAPAAPAAPVTAPAAPAAPAVNLPSSAQQIARLQQAIDYYTRLMPLTMNTPDPAGSRAVVQSRIDAAKQQIQTLQQQSHVMTAAEIKAQGLPEPATAQAYVQKGDGSIQSVKADNEPDAYKPVITLEDRRAQGIPDSDKAPYRLNVSTNKLEPVGGATTTVNLQNIEATEGVKARSKILAGYMDAGSDAEKNLRTIQVMRAANADPDLVRGPGAPEILQLKEAIGNLFGFQPQGTSTGEILSKLGTQLASTSTRALSARPAVFEFATFMKNNPGLLTSKEGNDLLLNLLEQEQQRTFDLSRLAENYDELPKFRDAEKAYNEQNPMFNPLTGQAYFQHGKQVSSATLPFDQVAKLPPAKVVTPDEARKFPPGRRLILPDGSPGQVPARPQDAQ